jgi:hypothetical protein
MPLRSGFHGTARVGQAHDPDRGTRATVTFYAPCQLLPGESGPVRIALESEAPPVASGAQVHLYDGTRLIATGTVR